MAEPKAEALARLQQLADVLGVPVDQFTTGKVPVGLMADNECLRLWSLLKTDKARQQALDFLRSLADEEGV